MDALDLLEQQHRDVAALIERIDSEPSPGARTSLVAELVRAIEAHSRVEERYFYAAVRARTGEDARLYEAFEDHALLRFAAQNLIRTRVTDVRFGARLKLVQELHARHAATEEDWVFPKAKRNLDDEDLDLIGTELGRAYELVVQSGFGHARPRPLSQGRRQRAPRGQRQIASREASPAKRTPSSA